MPATPKRRGRTMGMTIARRGERSLMAFAAFAVLAWSGAANALSFSLPWGEDGEQIEAVLNTTITAGASWRTEDRSTDLVGKASLNRDLCGRTASGRSYYQSCQGLFKDQTFAAERLAQFPGQYTINADDGNLNYGKGDLVQAPLKITQDFTASLGDFGIFVKGLYFYDFVNNDFTEHNPNRITRDNYLQVGNATSGGSEVLPLVPRNDSRACPPGRSGPPGIGCYILYGPGGDVYSKRRDGETLRQIGTDLQLLDAYFYGQLPLWDDKQLTFKIGRQNLNWGESTLLVFSSLNTINPVNANNFYRTGFQVEEVFQPVGMAYVSMEPFENTTLEAFYQYEWVPLEIPAAGSFYSFVDLGSYNAVDHVNLSFGSGADDPEQLGRLLDNPLSGLTNTSQTAYRLRDKNPDDGGQYGASLKYFAEWLNAGTELGFYFANYHSRLPMVSAYSVTEACSKKTTSTVGFLLACPGIPLVAGLLPTYGGPDSSQNGDDGRRNIGSAVNFDSLRIQLEYPEDQKMFGLSFNTTLGDFSIQGEVAYRPDEPLQVDLEDLVFSAFGPTLSNCGVPVNGKIVKCAGTGNLTGVITGLLAEPGLTAVVAERLRDLLALATSLGPDIGGVGTQADGSLGFYGSSDAHDCKSPGAPACDTYDLLVGHMTSSGRSFPSFLIPYRGTVIGTNAGSDRNAPLDRNNPGYIRGWEEFDTYQFNLGGTYVAGATDNPIGADQVLMLFETGATWVPGLPDLDVLQLEAPGTYLHASAGADGSGADGSAQACSSSPNCVIGPDGLRFNPRQQSLKGFPDKLSWGYVIISLIRYESVLPGISVAPQIVWKHDVKGTAPGLAGNFVEGRKQANITVETRYKSAFSFNLGYTWNFGGGVYNLNKDRDTAQAFVKFQF